MITCMYILKNENGIETRDTSTRDTAFYNKTGDVTEDRAWRKGFRGYNSDKIIYHYKYNDKGKKIEASYTMFGNKNIEKYDDEGRLIELDYQNIRRHPTKRIYTYNGNTAQCIDYNEKDSVVSQTVLKYNDQYKLFEIPEDEYVGRDHYTYSYHYSNFDKQGNWGKIVRHQKLNGNAFGHLLVTERQITYYQ